MATRGVGSLLGARRIAAWLALSTLWAVVALWFLANADHPKRKDPRAPVAADAFASAPQDPASAPGPGQRVPDGEPASAPPEVVQGLPEARRVGAAFAGAYATWRHDESPESVAARLAPHITPELAAQFRAPASGATAARGALAQQGEHATAVVEAVQTQELSAGGIELLVLVRQDIKTAAGVQTRRPSYGLHLSLVDGRWLVRDFTP